ncbi:MAG TPA: lipid II flippase MurJ [Polyangia bacterium]|nr:lipid II flippase MurJ [Polyangia bacterium]
MNAELARAPAPEPAPASAPGIAPEPPPAPARPPALVAVPSPSPRSLARTSLSLLPFQILFRGGEALLPLILAAWFGHSGQTDRFNLVWASFALIGSLVFGLFRDSALIPILVEVRARNPSALPGVLGSLAAHASLIGGALAALAGAGVWLWLRARYRAPGDAALATALVVPFSLQLLATTWRTFFEAALQARGWFRVSPMASAVGMATALGILAVTRHSWGVLAVAPALVVGDLAALAVLAPVALGLAQIRLSLTLRRPEPVRRFARRVIAELAGGAIVRVNPLVDQAMAAATGVIGGGTLLRLSQDASGVPNSLVGAALLPVLLSRLSGDFAERRFQRHRATARATVLAVMGALAVACVILFVVRRPLLRLLYLHGAMDVAGVERMAHLLPFHLLGVVPFGALLMLVRAHTSLGNSRIMFGMGLLNCLLNAGFNVIFRRIWGLEGIALSTSMVSAMVALVFWVRLRRAYRRLDADADPAVVS